MQIYSCSVFPFSFWNNFRSIYFPAVMFVVNIIIQMSSLQLSICSRSSVFREGEDVSIFEGKRYFFQKFKGIILVWILASQFIVHFLKISLQLQRHFFYFGISLLLLYSYIGTSFFKWLITNYLQKEKTTKDFLSRALPVGNKKLIFNSNFFLWLCLWNSLHIWDPERQRIFFRLYCFNSPFWKI